MARLFDHGVVPFYAKPRYKAANERELAGNIYPDLAAPDAQANARARRQAFDRDVHYLNHVLRNGVVPEEPPAQPRPRTSQGDLARCIYSDLVQEQEFEAYRQKYAKWEESIMKPWGSFGRENDMDAIDGFLAEVAKARDACVNVLDGFSGHVKSLHGQLTLAAEELDRQQRLGATMRARNQAEQERANKALAEANAELAKVRKTIESERKQWEREKESVRRTFDDILAGKKVA